MARPDKKLNRATGTNERETVAESPERQDSTRTKEKTRRPAKKGAETERSDGQSVAARPRKNSNELLSD
ncbi:hypothetical protein GWI33_004215 [Rhynchophorus ferrugineus]|uniref:Uncharacterized protein n=1 Tax=Rhynchophorus ferrugineus TaxID=354439 RepID=A0A834IMN3_RHYFE|nr:hypothetical protein GWI33_004215 [Rhynchophorus ferrugineus]